MASIALVIKLYFVFLLIFDYYKYSILIIKVKGIFGGFFAVALGTQFSNTAYPESDSRGGYYGEKEIESPMFPATPAGQLVVFWRVVITSQPFSHYTTSVTLT